MKKFLAFVFVCLSAAFACANTIPVGATGSCVNDINAIQNAVNSAQPRDVVQLAAGSYDFSCLNADSSLGVFVGNMDITIQGTPGQTVISGPGFAVQLASTAFAVGADDVTIDGVMFQNFFQAIFAGGGAGPANHFTVTNSTFQNNIQAIFIVQQTVAPRLVGNTFHVPTPPVSDVFAQFGQTFAVIVGRDCSGLQFSRNTITGPGVSIQFQSTDQLIVNPNATNEGLRTIGFFQADFHLPMAELGMITDNTITGLDAGMQSSSNLGVVTRNTVTNNAIGITISNDTDDGIQQVSGNVITQNVATGNQVGIWMASASGNYITLNDLRNNTLSGLLFLANPGGAPSAGNLFHQDTGAKIVGAQGNSSF
jgi:parallel beta-helix repeat protein